jgi:iron complex transport system permease protein
MRKPSRNLSHPGSKITLSKPIRNGSGFLWLLLLFTVLAALIIGRYRLDFFQDSKGVNPLFWQLFFRIRFPRVLLALLAGAGLATSGLVLQTIFRNPLADSGIIGVNQGAGFGAALGILFFGSRLVWVQTTSFLFSLAALVLTILLSSEIGRGKILPLVLSGIAVSALFSSGLGMIKYIADPVNQLPNIVFWLLGSLSATNWEIVAKTSLLIIPLLFFFYAYRWRLNIHSLDKQVAFSLGMKKSLETYLVLTASVLLTAVIISVAGIVSWVGLIIPNFSRLIFGSDTQTNVLNTMLMGGIFMIFCDTLARSLLSGEIPLGIFTALIGSGLFILLLTTRKIHT